MDIIWKVPATELHLAVERRRECEEKARGLLRILSTEIDRENMVIIANLMDVRLSAFERKLKHGSFSVKELVELSDILGYDVKIKKRYTGGSR